MSSERNMKFPIKRIFVKEKKRKIYINILKNEYIICFPKVVSQKL